jgi:hypothetical protein
VSPMCPVYFVTHLLGLHLPPLTQNKDPVF